MTQRTDSAHTPLSRFWLRSLLLHSLSCIGIVSLLSGNLVLAQEAAIDNFISTPSSNTQPQAAAPAPTTNLPNASQSKWQKLRQKLHSSSTQISTVRRVAQLKANFSSQRQAQKPIVVKPSINVAQENSGIYIDRTEYKIGATTGYEAPKSVILSERATGCKAAVRTGLSGSICGRSAKLQMRVARLSRYQTSGRLNKSKFIAKSGIRPIQLGPINVSANGFRVATNPQTKHSVLSYNRNFQPSGQPEVDNKFMFPLTIPAPITSVFGWRVHPITGNVRFHSGTDLGAPLGTPVLAAYPGTVEIADYMGGYGLTVVLDHNKSTLQSLYGHLSEIFVQPGEKVEQGTIIGRVGSTGNSTGPHLHFETRQLTAQGWVATNSGTQLEYAFARLVEALRTANAKPAAKVARGA